MTDEIKDEEFPGNSKMSRISAERLERNPRRPSELIQPPAKKRVEKAIQGRAVRKQKTFSQKLAETFFGDDTKSVGQYIIYEVLVPAAKNTIQEMVASGIEMLLYGETKGRTTSRRDRGQTIVSYGSFYRNSRRDERRTVSRGGSRYNLDEIVFENGREADEVLNQMIDLLEEYEQVTVSDFYELAGVSGATWADQKWGWDNLNKARCVTVRGGYIIDLPRPIELD